MIVGGKKIRALEQRSPAELPWRDLDVDVVVESTGIFTSRSTDKHRRQAQSAGVDRYIVKPFSDDALLGDVEALLGAAP